MLGLVTASYDFRKSIAHITGKKPVKLNRPRKLFIVYPGGFYRLN
ncbi:hypothetical protein [Pontibacter pudoricolor]|nr:hypothetical protein [Pontibacter pudoricolor]